MRIPIYILTALLCILIPTKAQERILLSGSGNTAILIVNINNDSIEWSHSIGSYEEEVECNSVDITDKGDILFAYKKGAKLIDRNHNTLWNYPAPQGCEIHNASILPDGGFLLAINGSPTRIIELTPTGKMRDSICIEADLGNDNPHMQCRQIRKAKNGNYLVCTLGKSQLYEIAPNGKTIRTYNLRGGAFSVVETENGDLLLPLGDNHCIQKIRRQDGKETAFIPSEGLHNCVLLFVGEIRPLKNGHWMVANWSGHNTAPNTPQIIEFDLTGKVYRTLNDTILGLVSTFCPIY